MREMSDCGDIATSCVACRDYRVALALVPTAHVASVVVRCKIIELALNIKELWCL